MRMDHDFSLVRRLMRGVRGNRELALTWVAILILVHPALFVLALLPSVPWFATVALLAYLAEREGHRRMPMAMKALAKVQLNNTHRQLLRDAALLVLAARTAQYELPGLAALTIGVLTLHALRGCFLGLREYVVRRRTLPIQTRNIDLSELGIPDAPPPVLMRGGARRPLLLLLPVVVGVLIDLLLGMRGFGVVGLVIGFIAGITAASTMLVHAIRVRHLADRSRIFQHIHEAVVAYRPEVALYFSSAHPAAYQANMWIKTLSNLKRRSIIIVRERAHVSKISPSSIPVVCLTSGSDVMNFEVPDLKVVLYVGNVGKNIHMLRNNNAKHVFIGHGDSDKSASANPFSKVYDEIWVAGQAGRDRYHLARSGVRDETIVEVGRPQLAEVEPAGTRTNPLLTVLYAPTFEGWTNDMYLTSLHVLGVRLIQRLLAQTPEIRVLYKPHPLTGVRDPNVRRAHKQIVAELAAANRERLSQPRWAHFAEQTAVERREAQLLLDQLKTRMKELRGHRPGADAAQQARDSGAVNDQALAELAECEARWHDAFWAAAGWWSHRTITGSRPSLYSCFNQADLLISDISSVVSDFISSGKPYVITNLDNTDPAVFRAQHTAARGAYLLDPECAELDAVLAAAQSPEADYMAPLRLQTRRYLLGPDQPDAMTRFSEAVEALIRKWKAERTATAENHSAGVLIGPRTPIGTLPC